MTIRTALFGKVQTRRDFIAVATPRPFLTMWEQWLQNAVAASREAMKGQWNDAFLTAPIWRFWLGADVCGSACIGAIMPSMDGVGRYFPLTIAAFADEGETFEPPEVDAQAAWFEAAEDFLLATLEMKEHEDVLAAFDRAPPPKGRPKAAAVEGVTFGVNGVVTALPAGNEFEPCFEALRRADPERAFSSSTFWWTVGGEGYPARAFAAARMPAPFVFSAMLTGRIAEETT